MKRISTCDTQDLTNQLHLLVRVMFRTGVYDCFLETQHRSTDDKYYSGFMVKDSDEVQLRGNSVFSYGRPNKPGTYSRDTPRGFLPRFKFIFFRIRLTVSSEIESITCRVTNLSANNCIVQHERPVGASLHT